MCFCFLLLDFVLFDLLFIAGPSGFRAFACVVSVAAGVVAILCLLKFKLPSLQYIASGAAALAGLLFFIAVCWDGNSVNRGTVVCCSKTNTLCL